MLVRTRTPARNRRVSLSGNKKVSETHENKEDHRGEGQEETWDSSSGSHC